MSQAVWSTINPATTSGTELATLLNDFKDAIMSGLSGTSRPSQLQAGGMWVDTTLEDSPDFLWTLKVYDGTSDITLFTINLATGSPSINGADASFTITKISANTAGAVLNLLKERVAGSGQVLSGDTLAEIVVKGTDDTGANINVARIRAVANDNYTITAAGSELVFECVTSGQTALSEVMRLRNGKVGIGTSTPSVSLHVLSTSGVRFERNSDDANGSILAFKKKRVTGTGQVQSNDVLAQQDFYGSDDAGSEAVSARIQAYAIENHTASAKGARVKIQTILAGATSLTDRVIFGSTIQFLSKLQIPSYILDSLNVATTATIAALSTTNAIANMTGSTATDIQGIDATGDSKVLVIHNNSTADLTLKHENGSATATNRLSLPDGDDVTVSPRQSVELFYHTGDTRWKLKSSAGGSGGGAISVQTAQTVAAGGTLTVNAIRQRQLLQVASTGGAVVLSNTPFGSGTFKEGAEIFVVCTSDTDTIEIPFADTAKGCVGSFGSIILNKNEMARFVYVSALSRFFGGKC